MQTTGNVQTNMHELRQASNADKENTEGWQISKNSFRNKTPVLVRNYTRALENQGNSPHGNKHDDDTNMQSD